MPVGRADVETSFRRPSRSPGIERLANPERVPRYRDPGFGHGAPDRLRHRCAGRRGSHDTRLLLIPDACLRPRKHSVASVDATTAVKAVRVG